MKQQHRVYNRKTVFGYILFSYNFIIIGNTRVIKHLITYDASFSESFFFFFNNGFWKFSFKINRRFYIILSEIVE